MSIPADLLKSLAQKAIENTKRLSGYSPEERSQKLEELIDAADIFFGIFDEPETSAALSYIIIKGEMLVAATIYKDAEVTGQSLALKANAIAVQDRNEATAIRVAFCNRTGGA